MRREQLGAVPSTFTTDCLDFCTTCELLSAGSGAATSLARVGARPPNTSGKPLVSSVSRSAEDSACARSGMSPLIPPRIALLRTALFSAGNGVEPSGTAISHATSSTATSEITAPPASSRRCSGRLEIARRTWVPSQPARVCPSTASAKIVTSETTRRVVLAVNRSATSGPTWRPISTPLKKPPNESAPMTNPWR